MFVSIEEKQFVARIDEIFQMVFELEIPIADVLVRLSQHTKQSVVPEKK